MQRGSICTGGTTCGNDRNLLDFMDVTVDGQGRVLVGYADGCTGACAQPAGAQNFDALATIARQTAGPRLFAACDPKPDLTVGASRPALGPHGDAAVMVTNAGAARATGGPGRLPAGRGLGREPVTLGAGASAWVGTRTKLPRGTTVITAMVDPADRSPSRTRATTGRRPVRT